MTSRIKGLEELEDLVRAKEFLYKVQGEYYIIGANMCRQCRDTILIQHFETYLGALHEVLDEIEGSDTKEAEPSSIKQLLEAYKLIRDEVETPLPNSAAMSHEECVEWIENFREKIDSQNRELIKRQIAGWLLADKLFVKKIKLEK